MMRPLLVALLLASGICRAQFPLTRTVDLRGPLREVQVRQVVQDAQGLLWTAHEKGLTCSDGRRSITVFDAAGQRVLALGGGEAVVACLANGLLLRCTAGAVDTLFADTTLAHAPPRALWSASDGTIWIGSYGDGLVLWKNGQRRRVGAQEGLGDDHVNALAPLAHGHMAVATDQGIDVLDAEGRVLHRFTAQQGLSDNLVLSLATDAAGQLWGGTHHGDVFRLDALDHAASPMSFTRTPLGAVRSLEHAAGRIWAGTEDRGVLVHDAEDPAGDWQGEAWSRGAITDITAISDGSVWWCSATNTVVRACVDADLFTEHEGLDLRKATALCITPDQGIGIATRQGVAVHPIGFGHAERWRLLPLPLQHDRPILSLQPTGDGRLWAGTFGDGVFSIAPDGRVGRSTEADGLCNANVMAMDARTDGTEAPLWFATLGGVCRYAPTTGVFTTVEIPGTRFVYDVQVLPDGSALLATDGNGIIRVDAHGKARVLGDAAMQRASFHSLCLDRRGSVWACGPGTGLCAVEGDRVVQRAPLAGEIFGIRPYGTGVLAFGNEALPYFDGDHGTLMDWAPFFDLEGWQAELNAMVTDPQGTFWAATDRGLLRLRPDPERLRQGPPVVITRWSAGDHRLAPDSVPALPYDRSDVEVRFAAPYYALSAGELRFEYRLTGLDTALRSTTDDRLFWPRLPAGNYRLAIRAVAARGAVQGPWTELRFDVRLPWWRTAWAIGAGLVLATLLFYAFIRAREERLRFRDRVEQDKARFELEVLRSQVNPHFLFNSFNTLTELIEVDREKAVEHVGQLSDFYREILQVRDKELVPLHEELRLVDTYFQLEKRRFGERIALELDVAEAALPLLLPPLTLQMLVENAVKHNTAEVNAPLVVHVVARGEVLEVWNPLRPRATAVPGTGFGVESIRKRYTGLSDRPVEVRTTEGRFTVRIPLLAAS